MEFLVLNQLFETIFIVDQYESILWVDRYYEPGEFEIYTPVTEDILKNVVADNYLFFRESNKLMIVENTTIETNVEDGNHIKIVGRSLESLLDRRCILSTVNATGSLQTTIKSLITDNIISPTNSDRRIPNFIFEESSDKKVIDLTYEGQFKGETLLDVIIAMCKSKDCGFKVVLNKDNTFVFSLYMGTDRSYNQEANDWVVFKPSFDNVISSNYKENHSESKTYCYIHGEYSVSGSQREELREVGEGTGLSRREHYIDSSISKEDSMSLDTWRAKLDEDGRASLSEKKIKTEFEGECETNRMFKYDKDFFLGDVCQVANEYGKEAPSRVTEYMWSVSESGVENYPTFTAIK